MVLYSLRSLYLLFYLFLAAQGMFYFVGTSRALSGISIEAFIEQRKAVDAAVKGPLTFLYVASVLLGMVLIFLVIKNMRSFVFVVLIISFLCLATDLTLAISKSMPLNQIINNYPDSSKIFDMEEIRKKWLFFIHVRGTLSLMGLLMLLSGLVWESYNGSCK